MDERSIFSQASLLDPARRDEFLGRSCGGDEGLRSRVEALLKCQQSLGGFLETPALEQELSNDETPADLNQTLATGQASRPEVVLDFLAPSQRPDSLGRLGHYEVLDVVGRGGMGMVLRAFDEKLHRVVALKVVFQELVSTPSGRKRFIREAVAAAQVSHENVVQIHAVADEGEVPYLVMQYVEGKSLDDRLKEEGSLEVKEVVRIGLQIASGLAAAHKQGLIHRDIKPANILLENGVQRVKITDFGLARASDDVGVTQSGMIAGTPQYMSPEQAQDYPIDPRSDLFSLGSLMYSMCTGRPPFRGNNTVAVLRRLCEDPPRPIQEINPEIPDWLCEIIDKLLAKQPAQRYQTAQEVADLLGEHLARLQQPVRSDEPHSQNNARTTVVPPLEKSKSRGRLVAAGLAVVAALVVGGILVIQTDRGELVIETDDPDIAFRVLPNGVKLEDRKTDRQYDLKIAAQNPRTGEYQLEVTDKLADMGITTKTFTIRRGERVALKVHPRPAKPVEPTNIAKVEAPPPRETSLWTSLFNGKDLTGWKVIAADPASSWTVKEGILRGSGPASYLATEADTFANFHVRAELRINAGGDSGLYFRTAFPGAKHEPPDIAAIGYEAQVLGLTGIPTGTGALFAKAPIAFSEAPAPQPGTWFVLEVIAEGNRLRTLVDGQVAANAVDAERRAERGQLALQVYGADTVIECRKLQFQELPSTSTPPLAVAPFDERQARVHQEAWAKRLAMNVEISNSLGLKLRLIPPGEFLMGSPESDSYARDREKPQHVVRHTKPFYAGVHEVTIGQFRAFVEATGYVTDAEQEGAGSWLLIDLPGKGRNPDWNWRTPGFEQTDEHPVCCVSWRDAERFCAWLSAKEKQLYHLPTEAQWEYACRAGTATPYHFGDQLDAAATHVRAKGTAAAGSYAANAFGLHDMHGNVYEWCQDGRRDFEQALAIDPVGPVGKGVERLVRGGAWSSTPNSKNMAARAAARAVTCAADRPFHGLGFRVILVPEVPKQ